MLYGVGAVAVVIVTILVARLKPASPTVERSIVSIDSVRQGDMIREVRGPGTLVPEHIRRVVVLTSRMAPRRCLFHRDGGDDRHPRRENVRS